MAKGESWNVSLAFRLSSFFNTTDRSNTFITECAGGPNSLIHVLLYLIPHEPGHKDTWSSQPFSGGQPWTQTEEGK